MANPQNPVTASFPIPPPVGNFPFIDMHTGGLTPMAWEFLQKLWAAIQGGGGLIDADLLSILSPGVVAGYIESLAGLPVFRLYGNLARQPASGEILFSINMVGDEYFAPNMGRNIGTVTAAPFADCTFPILVNGAQIGSMDVAAGSLVATWTLTDFYVAAPNDIFEFQAPNPADSSMSGPRYTFVGDRRVR